MSMEGILFVLALICDESYGFMIGCFIGIFAKYFMKLLLVG